MGKFTSGEEVHYAEINEISERIRERKVSPGEVVKASLGRIEKVDLKLNAFITVLADEALEQAKAAEAEIKAGDWRGSLHGIPVGIKDFSDTAGVKTTAAFEHFKDRVPAKDAAGVAKLKQAGAIVIGKMNMHELGMGTTSLVSTMDRCIIPGTLGILPAARREDQRRQSRAACVTQHSIPTRLVLVACPLRAAA